MHDVRGPSRRVINTDGFMNPAAIPAPRKPAPRLRLPIAPNRKQIAVSPLIQKKAQVAPAPSAPLPRQAITRPRMRPGSAATEPRRHFRFLSRLRKRQSADSSDLRKPKIPTTKRRIIKRIILGLVLIVLLAGGCFGWKIYRATAKISHNNNPLHLLSVFKPVPLKSQDGRINVLLAGNSADDPGHEGASLTDSIMILSISTKDKSAYMLSIPRDTWVNIPSMGHQKINAANTVSDFSAAGYPKGGMGQLEQIITENFGIPINYYALVDYTAFRDTVNAVGGITVDIKSSDPRGLYDPSPIPGTRTPIIKLANGPKALNGQTALNLARARGDAYGAYGFPQSDFNRTEHQRQMIMALKTKIATTSVLANPLKIGELAGAISKTVRTDMQLNEIQSFYVLSKDISDASIQSYNINTLVKDTYLLTNYRAANGQLALAPSAGPDDFSQIKAAIKKLMTSDPVVRESATVVVLNGTGITGLARKQADKFTEKGMTVAAVADAPTTYAKTIVVDKTNGQKPDSVKLLQTQYGVTAVASEPVATRYDADIVIILGQDQAPKPDTQ